MSSAITRAYRLARLPAGLLVICVLAACSSTDSAADGASTVMTQAAQLALGTIDLEGTDQAVDGGSASKQLPLWQLLADMSASTTACPSVRSRDIHVVAASDPGTSLYLLKYAVG